MGSDPWWNLLPDEIRHSYTSKIQFSKKTFKTPFKPEPSFIVNERNTGTVERLQRAWSESLETPNNGTRRSYLYDDDLLTPIKNTQRNINEQSGRRISEKSSEKLDNATDPQRILDGKASKDFALNNIMSHNLSESKEDKIPQINISKERNNDLNTPIEPVYDNMNTNIGFQTAKGNRVKISASALEKTKILFSTINGVELEDTLRPEMNRFDVTSKGSIDADSARTTGDNLVENRINNTNQYYSGLQGFSTAKGTKVAISTKAIEIAKKILNDHEENIEATMVNVSNFKEKENNQSNYSSNISGFSTAKGSIVTISSEALESATKIISSGTKTTKNENDLYLQKSKTSRRSLPAPELKNSLTARKRKSIAGNPNQSSLSSFGSLEQKKVDAALLKKKETIVSLFEIDKTVERFSYTALFSELTKFTQDDLVEMGFEDCIISMNFEKAKSYKFNGIWGYLEAFANLIEAGAVKHLISEQWVENHYGLIVWKIASLLRCFPTDLQKSKLWNRDEVLNQLKYRYEVEVVQGRRSCLRLISEKDSVDGIPLVLFIAGSISNNEILLSDGWYTMKALLDDPLTSLHLNSNKLSIGTKLFIIGPQIVHNTSCPPLEIPDSSFIRLSFNSCRRAKWDTKLGFFKSLPFYSSLIKIDVAGGIIPRIILKLVRIYPLCFIVKYTTGRRTVYHNIEQISQKDNESSVSTVLRLKVIDEKRSPAFVTVWNTNIESLSTLRIGFVYEFFNLRPIRDRKNKVINLVAAKNSFWKLTTKTIDYEIPPLRMMTCSEISKKLRNELNYCPEIELLVCTVVVRLNKNLIVTDDFSSIIDIQVEDRLGSEDYDYFLREGNSLIFSNLLYETYDENLGIAVIKFCDETTVSRRSTMKSVQERLEYVEANSTKDKVNNYKQKVYSLIKITS